MGTARKQAAAYETIVIGAGAVGLTTAWRLAQRGRRVLVLDAGDPGGGASRAAAGMLAPVSEADFGEEALTRLNLAAAQRWPGFAAELEQASGEEIGYLETGTLTVGVDRDEAELLRRVHDYQRSLGLESEWLTGRECRRLEPGLAARVAGGISAPHDHQVSARAVVSALVAAVRGAGVDLRAQTRVAELSIGPGGVEGVALRSGELIPAADVVIAAGAESALLGGLPAEALVPVRPVRGQILRLRATRGTGLPSRVVGTPEVYAVPRADGRLVVGATVEEQGFDRTVTAGGVLELLRRAYEVLPGVAELELVEATAGLRPATPDNGPAVGASGVEGLVWATGHWRNGILQSPITGEAVAAVVAGEPVPPELEPFSPARFVRRPAEVAG